MEKRFEPRGRDLPASLVGARRLNNAVLGGLASVSFLLGAGSLSASVHPVFGQSATIELSPMVAKSTAIAHTDSSKEISVVLVLPLRDPQGAAEFAQRVSAPNSGLHGKFLTPKEFAAAYGADERDYAAVKKWATDNGLKISQESVARTALTVRGTVAQFEALFNTQINDYRSPKGDAFYSASSKPIIPIGIAAKIIGVIGLTNSKQLAPLFHVAKTFGETPSTRTTDTSGRGPGGAYNAADLRNIYVVPPQVSGAAAWTVAVFEQGGFTPSDVQTYLTANKLPSPPVTAIGYRRR
jgi:kumamolisin